MDDATGLTEALLGLDGFRVLAVEETASEVVVTVETVEDFVGCPTCGVRAEAKDRIRVDIRDLPCFGRPARLVWLKRRWRCADPDCAAKTWTEGTEHVAPRAVLTLRAGAEATRQVGELALPVAVVARELGVCWWTVMDAVVLHGTPLVDDPGRVKKVRALGIDETSFLAATREHRTIYVTGLVDLNRKTIIDMVEGNAAPDLRRWCADQDSAWMSAIRVVATDLAESYRNGTSPTSTMPSEWLIPFTWSASPTAASTRCAGASRTRRSGTGAERPIRSIGSASSSSLAMNVSTSAAMTASCSGCATVIPTTNSSAPGWPRSRCATST